MDAVEITKPTPALPTPLPAPAPGPTAASCCSTASFPPDVVRSWIGDRRVLAFAGLGVGGGGLALGWDWLAAVGIAPLIVAAAPCLIMCALGMCMMGRGSHAHSGQAAPAADDPEPRSAPPSGSER